MYRDREKETDETEEISLEDTQEFNVANSEAETREERRIDFDAEEFDDGSDLEDESDEGGPEFEDDADDDYVEDEYFEDEVDLVDQETEEAELPGTGREPEESVSGHLKAAGAAAVARVRRVKLPEVPKPNVPKLETGSIVGVVAIVIAALVVGVGAFFLGKGTGDDVDTARLEGAAAGKQAGAIEGASKGYAAGFQEGRDAGFEKAYIPAYKLNYKRAFEQAGLDAPADDEIDVPDP
ncbi:MAG: hypothetical protein JJE13_10320 [Thermoleophilia bacterium]|nr:hypothetical protein [Thermoleophilia bacterium]